MTELPELPNNSIVSRGMPMHTDTKYVFAHNDLPSEEDLINIDFTLRDEKGGFTHGPRLRSDPVLHAIHVYSIIRPRYGVKLNIVINQYDISDFGHEFYRNIHCNDFTTSDHKLRTALAERWIKLRASYCINNVLISYPIINNKSITKISADYKEMDLQTMFNAVSLPPTNTCRVDRLFTPNDNYEVYSETTRNMDNLLLDKHNDLCIVIDSFKLAADDFETSTLRLKHLHKSIFNEPIVDDEDDEDFEACTSRVSTTSQSNQPARDLSLPSSWGNPLDTVAPNSITDIHSQTPAPPAISIESTLRDGENALRHMTITGQVTYAGYDLGLPESRDESVQITCSDNYPNMDDIFGNQTAPTDTEPNHEAGVDERVWDQLQNKHAIFNLYRGGVDDVCILLFNKWFSYGIEDFEDSKYQAFDDEWLGNRNVSHISVDTYNQDGSLSVEKMRSMLKGCVYFKNGQRSDTGREQSETLIEIYHKQISALMAEIQNLYTKIDIEMMKMNTSYLGKCTSGVQSFMSALSRMRETVLNQKEFECLPTSVSVIDNPFENDISRGIDSMQPLLSVVFSNVVTSELDFSEVDSDFTGNDSSERRWMGDIGVTIPISIFSGDVTGVGQITFYNVTLGQKSPYYKESGEDEDGDSIEAGYIHAPHTVLYQSGQTSTCHGSWASRMVECVHDNDFQGFLSTLVASLTNPNASDLRGCNVSVFKTLSDKDNPDV